MPFATKYCEELEGGGSEERVFCFPSEMVFEVPKRWWRRRAGSDEERRSISQDLPSFVLPIPLLSLLLFHDVDGQALEKILFTFLSFFGRSSFTSRSWVQSAAPSTKAEGPARPGEPRGCRRREKSNQGCGRADEEGRKERERKREGRRRVCGRKHVRKKEERKVLLDSQRTVRIFQRDSGEKEIV